MSANRDLKPLSPNKRAYAMFECKSWGAEYAKERNRLLEDGGQLFSYYVQEQNAETLYLYSAKIAADVSRLIEFLETSKLKGKNKNELFGSGTSSYSRTVSSAPAHLHTQPSTETAAGNYASRSAGITGALNRLRAHRLRCDLGSFAP